VSNFKFDLKQAPETLTAGLDAIRTDHPGRFVAGDGAWAVSFVQDDASSADALSATLSGEEITVRFGSKSAAFRALGMLLSAASQADLTFSEASQFTMRGLMVDCSRNGVLRPDAARAFMRRCALMGVNMLMLYTEDTYEVPGEPFFGYLRGAYTMAEMKALDDYADALGIELIPCIQALGHLAQTLQWPAMDKYRDTNNVLLAGDDETYDLIRRLIQAASSCVRSKRVHLGMDEAFGLGTGQFKERFGEKPPFEIMNEHLARVRSICREEGLTPMIWSDMYFRLGSKTHTYYDMDWEIPEDIVANIPKDVQLVYWDYYHGEVETYQKMIEFHRRLGSTPIMGGGIWTWSHMWCALPWSFTAVNACMSACRQEGIDEVFMTMWGDDGMEVDIFSALPGIQYFCEQAFGAADPMAAAQKHFAGVCGCPMQPWVRAADIDSVPLIEKPEISHASVARALLWQDPALTLLDPTLGDADLRPWYGKLASELSEASQAGGLARRLEYPAAIASVLELKTHLRRDLSKAIAAGDRKAVRALAQGDLAELRQRVEALWKRHRATWMETYKPFGWEVIEGRYGTVIARLATLQDRLDAYAAGDLDDLPELTAELQNPWPGRTLDGLPLSSSRVRTPSCIK
jgi:hexosaminidase